jgi:hypothetical protein
MAHRSVNEGLRKLSSLVESVESTIQVGGSWPPELSFLFGLASKVDLVST